MSEQVDWEKEIEECIRQGDEEQRRLAFAWSTAIGLQAVDNLKASDYLVNIAIRNIKGEITMDEVENLIDSYYEKNG